MIGHHALLMTEAGHRVRIVAGRGAETDPRIPFIAIPAADSRQAEVLEVKKHLDAGRVPAEFEPLSRRIEGQLLETLRNADFLIAHNVCSLNKNLPLTAALRRISDSCSKPRFILWHHDLAWTTPRYRNELHEGRPWDLLRTDWPKAIQVVISEPRRQELAELLGVPRGRIHVIANGIDVAGFLSLGRQAREFMGQLDLPAVAPLMLLPVRITPRKNIELALRVLAKLRNHFGEAKLVVTGPLGPHNPANISYFEDLVALRRELHLEDAAVFLAELTNQSLPDQVVSDFYRLSDILFLPSREEGFGIPILEAGLAGIPVFCADIPPLRELGGPDAHYFSPDDDPIRVAALIATYLEESSAFSLRRRVRRSYSWDQIYATKIAPLLAEG